MPHQSVVPTAVFATTPIANCGFPGHTDRATCVHVTRGLH